MKRTLRNLICFLLCLTMVIPCLPLQVWAQELQSASQALLAQESLDEASIAYELVDQRDAYTKVFRLNDGSLLAAVYPQAVHYQGEDGMQEIDNTLQETDYKGLPYYRNTAGPMQVLMPRQAGRGPVIYQVGEKSLSFAYEGLNTLTDRVRVLSASLPEGIPAGRDDVALPQLYSGLSYDSLEGTVGLAYHLTGTALKEELILKSPYHLKTSYSFVMYTQGLTPVLEADGRVILVDGDREVLSIAAPFMTDADGRYSQNVGVALEELADGGWRYRLTPDAEWLSQATFPVVIDPPVDQTGVDRIKDTTGVFGTNISLFNTNDEKLYLKVGNRQGYQVQAMIYGALPAVLKTGSTRIVNAQLSLAGYTGSFSSCENGLTVCAYRIIKDWNTANVEENNVLALGSDSYSDGSTVLDHVTVNDNVLADHHHVTYSLDITRAAQMWLEGTAPNYGISLRGLTNTTGNYARFIDSTNTATAALCPTFVYQYRDSVGVEDYWTFTSVEAGRGGVAAVNNFNGNLVLQQELTASTGNNAPVSVSISYSQNLASDGKKTGLGAWRTNYHMRVVALADPLEYAGRSYPYYLQDSDGTCHYFYQDGSVYRDEDGLGYQLELVDEEEFRYRIVTKDETELKFDWWGRWKKVTDSQGNYNLICARSYTDSTDFAIDYILEGSAASTDTRRTEFTYQSTGVTVTSPEGVSVTLGLDSAGRLAYIHYPDSTASAGRTTFTYDALGRPVSVANGWGQVTGITYNAQSQACRVSRLSWGTPGESTPLEFCAFSYAHNYTTVTDQRGQRLEYQFDTFGHTAGVVDPALGLGQRYAYGAPGGTDGEAHRLLEATDTYYASHTLVNQGFFENSASVNGWTTYPTNASFGKSWREGLGAVTSGSCLQLTKPASITADTSVNQSVSTVTPGRYVLSAYVYTTSPLEGTGAMLSIQAFTASGFRANNLSYPVRSTDGVWQRLQVAFTVAQGDTRLNVGVFLPGDTVGTLYVDDIQLERAPVAGAAGELNLLSSTAFVNGLSGWSLTGTGSVVTPADAPATVQNALQLTGHPLTATAARKSVAFAGQKGDSFVFGAWAKGNSIGLAGSEQYKAGTPGFGLLLELLDANGTVVQQTPVTGFNPAIDSWQFAHGSCVAEKAFSQVRLTLSYAYNASTAQFALPFVYADTYSQTYAYDAQGNLTDAVSLSQSQSAYAYQDDRLTSSLSPTGSRFLYDYQLNSPQIYSAFSNGGQRTYHVYNTTGDLTQFTVVDTPVLTSPRKEGGTVRATLINADGGRSLFAYTLTTGYPVYCTPSYGWNAMKWDLVSASATDDTLYVLRNVAQPGLALTANAAGTSYTVSTYTAGSPATAQIFRLEAWGDGTFRLLSAASGYTKCLAEAPQRFHYQGSTNRLLVSQDSTDTDLSARWYLVDADSQHRMVASATYSQDGNYLLSATDEAGHTTTYTYNAQGLTQTVTDPNGNVTGYTYDAMGRTLSASLDGAKVEYTYAQDQLSQVEVDDTVSYRFSYDAYGRRREIRLEGADDPVLATYAYAGNDLASLTYTNGVSVSYTYDSHGRLTGKTFSDSQEGVQYVYDAQGRLWRSRDSLSQQTSFFEYDRLGRNVSASLTNHALDQVLATRQLRYNDQKNTLSQSLVRLYADRSQLVQYQYTYGDPALGQIPDALVQMIVDGRGVSFAYDRLGRLSQRSLAFAGTTKSQSYTYQTNAQGNDTTRIATYTDLLGTTHTYTYDANGNILTDSYSGLTYSYEYDSQDRLVRVNDPVQNLTQTYTYDDRGNCTRKDTYAYTTGALGTGTAQFYGYGYQAWPDALTWAGGELLSYTGGNPDNWTQNRSFAWTGGRNLQSVYQNDTLLALYNYDSAGLRVSKLTGAGSTQYYILDSQYQGQVSTINGQSYTLSYYWDEAGVPMGVKLNGSAYFFVKNLQGDVVAITDYQGNVAARYTYDVWGKLLSVVNGAGNPVTDPTHVANLNPFRYRGYFYDTETGFYYLTSRYYDPEVGRFINSDSYVSTGQGFSGNNMFIYCGDNPVNRVDPTGGFWKEIGDFFGHIFNAFFTSFEGQTGLGVGAGLNLSDVLKMGVSRDFYVGFDDGVFVTGNIVTQEISLFDSIVSSGDTYDHRVEEDGVRVSSSGNIDDGPLDMIHYPDVTHGNQFSFGPFVINEAGDFLISVSISAHLGFGGHAGIAFNISEFVERLFY